MFLTSKTVTNLVTPLHICEGCDQGCAWSCTGGCKDGCAPYGFSARWDRTEGPT